jgi:hypothetical protein
MSGTLTLRPVDPRTWDDAVAAHPAATPFHLAAFLTTAGRCLGQRTHLTLAEARGEVLGAVPLLVRSQGPFALVNHRVPFPYLGPLLREGMPPDAVLPAVRRHLRPRQVLHFGVQSVAPFCRPTGAGWTLESDYESSVVPVEGRTDEDLLRLMTSHRRNRVRKAMREGLRVEPATREEITELLPRWSGETFRRQGLPARRPDGAHAAFYDALVPSGIAVASAVRRDGEPVLVALDLVHGRRAVGWEVGISEVGRDAGATLVLYYELMRLARDAGAAELDMLGSTNEGMIHFKRSMGAQERPRGVARWTSPLLPLGKQLVPQRLLQPLGGSR